MGGIGSGRRTNRPTTDECIRIDLPLLKHLGMLKRGCMSRRSRVWSRSGKTIAELTLVADIDCQERYPCLKMTGHAFGQKIDHLVVLDSAPLPFGGERWYALCPFTRGKRCSTLVLPPGKLYFASVKGWKVPYASQRECEVHRAYRAIDKATIRMQELSKYTRRPTRERLWDKIETRQAFVDQEIDRLESMIW